MSKLLLIAPVSQEVHGVSGKSVHHLSLAILAALAEPYFSEIEIAEEMFAPLDLDQTPDLVGITMMTCQANRGYWLADYFRRRGSKVILGGAHVSFMVAEALEHADAVVQGEVEGLWPQIMADFSGGNLSGKHYTGSAPLDLSQVPVPRKDLFPGGRTTFDAGVIQSSRGCPMGCDFCTVTKMYGKLYRTRPVEQVVEEIRRYPKKAFFFVDDNIFFSHEYAYRLFEALIPLRIKWGSQASLELACRDGELLKLAVRSGCASLFVGFESVNQENLNANRKTFNKVDRYDAGIRKLNDAGIAVFGAFIFGLEKDTPQTFRDTMDFVMRNRLFMVNPGILTPLPGTVTHARMERDGDILDYNYEHYTCGRLIWRHPNMTTEELERCYLEFRREFFSLGSIARRFWNNRRHPLLYLALNLAHHRNTYYRPQGREHDRITGGQLPYQVATGSPAG
ncbi:MAG: B12-binding domain-containing radical SAM protein [Deltaproteobacteria bacterium]|nr:B12-binding domain-containing radical SAM protein [Deltaproteobacteria bacterium]